MPREGRAGVMKTKLCLLLLTLTLLLVPAPPRGEAAARPVLSPEAEKVARDFLFAFTRNDRDAITALLPKKLENLYGPSPFARVPTLSKPRADERMGAIEFQGGRSDPALPDKGVMVMRKMQEGGKTVWRVRQIYWYDELPPEAGQVPDKSKTAADRAEEPRLRQAATEFLQHWMAGDFKQLDQEVFHWWDVDRKPPRWVKMTRVELRPPATSLGGLRVAFRAKLRVLGALSKRVDGNVWLVQEDGVWRVRPLTVAFWF
jgi:hypothetical protein